MVASRPADGWGRATGSAAAAAAAAAAACRLPPADRLHPCPRLLLQPGGRERRMAQVPDLSQRPENLHQRLTAPDDDEVRLCSVHSPARHHSATPHCPLDMCWCWVAGTRCLHALLPSYYCVRHVLVCWWEISCLAQCRADPCCGCLRPSYRHSAAADFTHPLLLMQVDPLLEQTGCAKPYTALEVSGRAVGRRPQVADCAAGETRTCAAAGGVLRPRAEHPSCSCRW